MIKLSGPKIILYSLGALGGGMVFWFANMAFPLFLTAYPVSNLLVGFLSQERSLVGAVVQPVVGTLSDHFPPNPLGRRRPLILIGVVATALSIVLLSTYPPLWAVIAILTLFSLFLAIATVPYTALMPDITPSSQRGRVGGVMALFGMLGATSIIALAYVLWDSQRTLLFVAVAAGLLITFAITLWTIKESPTEPSVLRKAGRLSVRAYLGDLLERREVTKYLVATFFFWVGNGGITPFVTRFAVDVLRVEENFAFVLVLPAIVGGALFAVPAGLAAERYGKKRVLCTGMALFGLSAIFGAVLLHSVPQAIALMSLVGIANAITTALMFPLLTDIIPRDRVGEFTGINALVGSLAQPIGALGAGFIADTTGTLRAAFAAGGLMILVGSAILMGVRLPLVEREERELPQAEDAAPSLT